jgi:hypothetical protein
MQKSVFKYSTEEWAAISRGAQVGCVQPARLKRANLSRALKDYLKQQSVYRPPSANAKAWKKVARLMKQTRTAIDDADPDGSMDELIRLIAEKEGDDGTTVESILDVLDRWERIAEVEMNRCIEHPRAWHPRKKLYYDVFDLWTDAGGLFKISRGAPDSVRAGQLGGPLLRYLQAVLTPLMGEEAPTLEGLRKIIERYAADLEVGYAEDEELAVVTEAIQNNEDEEAAAMAVLTKRRKSRGLRHDTRLRAHRLVHGPGRSARI